jgi:tetratricopeptide (TPR) repeat protein
MEQMSLSRRVPVSALIAGAALFLGGVSPSAAFQATTAGKPGPKTAAKTAAAPKRTAPARPAPAAAKPPAPKPPVENKDPFARGRDHFQAGRLDEALAAFQQAAAEEPNDPLVQSWHGFLLFKKGRYDDAIQALTRSIQLAPRNPDTYNNLGNAQLAKGNVDAAIEAYRQAVELVMDRPGNNANPYYNLGNALVKKGDLDAALEAFLEAEKHDSSDPFIQNNLGFVYERKHAQDPAANPIAPAIEHYGKAIEKQPDNPVFQRNLGLAARKQEGRRDAAILALRRAVQLDPKDYDSHLALAEEYQNAGRLVDAVNFYKKAVHLRPNEFVPRYNLGLLYARQAKEAATVPARNTSYTAALNQLSQAVKLRPTDHRVLSALGWVSFQLRRFDDAVSWYQKGIQAAPAGPDLQAAHANLGLVLDNLGESEKAVHHWKEALKLDPSDAATRGVLASAYLSRQQYPEAAAEYREVIRVEPKNARAHNNLGFALEKLGKVDEAIAAYKEAIELDAKMAIAHNNLGALYERQGQRDLAKQCYLKARQIDPNFEDAKKNLQRLGG